MSNQYLKNARRSNSNAIIFNKSQDYTKYTKKIEKEKRIYGYQDQIASLEERINSLEEQIVATHLQHDKEISELFDKVWELMNK